MRKNIFPVSITGPDGQLPSCIMHKIIHQAVHFEIKPLHLQRIFIDNLPRFGQLHILVRPVQQACSHTSLQGLNVLTHRRLGHMKLFRSAGEVPAFHGSDEDKQRLIHTLPPLFTAFNT
ncbi:hypothetical protein D3C72_827570 [compost metagenome]